MLSVVLSGQGTLALILGTCSSVVSTGFLQLYMASMVSMISALPLGTVASGFCDKILPKRLPGGPVVRPQW